MSRKVSYYVDEHVGKAVVKGLRQRGVDVLTLAEADMLGADDIDHVERARAEGRVIVTQDEDFLRLHAEGIEHPGIAYSPQGTAIGRMIRGLMLIFQVLDAEDMQGHVEYL